MEPATPLMGSVNYRRKKSFTAVMNEALSVFFKDMVRVAVKDPRQAVAFVQTANYQRKASRRRSRLAKEGLHVPPIMLISVTDRCNLHCRGCYHQVLQKENGPEMTEDKVRSLLQEARELGISFIGLAGGEPLVRQDVIAVTAEFPEIIFLAFTNGTLIDSDFMEKISGQRNFVPVISMEGWQEDTDERRGRGVYERLAGTISRVRRSGLFWAVSLTVTCHNFDTITDRHFIEFLHELGCKLFFFVEYTPVSEDTSDWVLTDEQRSTLLAIRDTFRKDYAALFIAVPGDEEEIGGCLSAGRGFIHVSAQGAVEPCPFVPVSDTSLMNVPLREALQSPFLRAIRDRHEHLHETANGCALWAERAWVRSLLGKE